jgi:hypothetical protein
LGCDGLEAGLGLGWSLVGLLGCSGDGLAWAGNWAQAGVGPGLGLGWAVDMTES